MGTLALSRDAARRRHRGASLLRDLLQVLFLIPVVRWFCRPMVVEGRERVPEDPTLFVANHASHADTAAVIAALPWRVRRRLAPAAAEDYFFSSRIKGASVRMLTGAFPFPRHGDEGLHRARRLLAQGSSVLLFPEGTRSRDGAIAPFKCGVAKLATLGYPVVPIGIAGTGEVLGAGRSIPRRAPVAICFGEAEYFDNRRATRETAAEIEGRVRAVASHACQVRPQPRASWRSRVAALAGSRIGLAIAFCWGVSEAIAFPIVPDFFVALLALAAPSRAWKLALAAVTGSVAGGALTYLLGAILGPAFLSYAPLVTERMMSAAGGWLDVEGARALARQPLSGVPYKAFAWQAADAGVGFWSFVGHTVLARAPRILGVGAVFAGVGWVIRRWIERLYPVLAATFVVVFVMGFARVVRGWS